MANWTRRLKALREENGVTREQLGRRTAVTAATIKAYELGYRNPSRELIIALLHGLDADITTRIEILEAAGFSREGRAEGDPGFEVVRGSQPGPDR